MEEDITEPYFWSRNKKRGKRVATTTQALVVLENQIIPLSSEDIASQLKINQHSAIQKKESW
jgi:hypothetical protein